MVMLCELVRHRWKKPWKHLACPPCASRAESPPPYLPVALARCQANAVDWIHPVRGGCDVVAHPWIESTRGCVAIERGPLVYCIEQADHPGTRIADLEIDAAAPLQSAWEPDTLDGVTVIRARGWEVDTK